MLKKYLAIFLTAVWLSACGGGGSSDSGPGPTRFVEHPRDQTVAVGASATFTASFAGEAPLGVNWTRGGVAIAGATSTTYVTPPATATDDGVTFGLALTVPGGRGSFGTSLHSQMATLAVVPPPPTVRGVFTIAGPMMQARVSHTATLLPNGKVLLAGGAPPDATPATPAIPAALASAELYDPVSNTFTATGSMSTARAWHTATPLADGRVLIAGGQPFADVSTPQISTAEIYDPATGRFTATGSMTVLRSWHSAVRHGAARLPDGKVLIAGGSYTAGSSAELFDPATGTFSATGSMIQGRDLAQAEVLADGRVLIVDGGLGNPRNEGDLYHPATGTFTATSPAQLSAPWRDMATARLADGRVLVVGGRHGIGTGVLGYLVAPPLVPAAQLFDPVTNAFTPSGLLIWPRQQATATRLADGRVLVFGGVGDDRWPNRGEVYDPIAATFTATAPLDLGRYGHTATLLHKGKVLIAGGWAASSSVGPRVAAPAVLFEQY